MENLHEFLPLYNVAENSRFLMDINNLTEFTKYKLAKEEDFPTHPGDLMKHQQLISNFISPNTPYDGLLLMHEMGSGKSCTAVAVAERFIKSTAPDYPVNRVKKILVLTKGKGLHANFVNEIANVCTAGEYLNKGDSRSVTNDYKKILKNVKVNYTFNTFEIFAKGLRKTNDIEKVRAYEDTLFIVDEAHNLRSNDDNVIYKDVYDLFSLLKRKKILLLTGTPMKDKPEEIVGLLNLIVKDKLKLEDLKNIPVFKKKVTGYVSYLKSITSDVVRIDEGSLIGELTHLRVHSVVMSDFQSAAYSDAMKEDNVDKSIFNNSRQAASIVFPDSTYGKLGFETNVTSSGGWYKFSDRATISELRTNLEKYSVKYADLIRKLDDDYAKERLSFVFSEFVKGSGLVVLSLLLEMNGYTRVVNPVNIATFKEKRYAVFTNDTSTTEQTRRIISFFNHPRNSGGRYLSTILGSKVIMEGFSFKNIQSEYILTPHWNYSETSQIIARGFRVGSHRALFEKNISLKVKVYHYVAMPTKEGSSIDLHMYEISEKKDFEIQKVTKTLKEVSFDCQLNKIRNTVTDPSLVNTRECEYSSCEYQCDNSLEIGSDTRNYKLLYWRYSKEYYDLKKFIILKIKTLGAITLEDIMDATTRTKFEIACVAQDIMDNRSVLFSRPEGSYYLVVHKNIFYGSKNLKNQDTLDGDFDPFLNSFYSRYVPVFVGKSIDELVFDSQQNFMVTLIHKIFKSKNLKQLQSYVGEAPLYLQEKLLCYSINSDFTKTTAVESMFVKNMILNNYKLYYSLSAPSASNNLAVPPMAFVWLVEDNPTCSNDLTNTRAWRKCTVQEKQYVSRLQTFNKIDKSVENPYGYIGLVNRLTNDFCLTRVDTAISEVNDKRKRNVGKRCQNWKKADLIDLAANRIKIDPEDDFNIDMVKMRSDPKFKTLLAANGTRRDYKRVAFWNAQGVDYICRNIMEKLTERKLVVNDPNCGTTKKIR
jgi:superfamily II DNA or RNA helicase